MSSLPRAQEACCAVLYGDPLIELLAGESLHPGGLAASRRLLASAGLSPGQRILDAGCGLGATARLAALEFALAVDACDSSAEAIRRAIRLADDTGARIRFTEASLLRLPYADGSFAGVLAECILSTTSRPAALREVRRVMPRGGVLLVSDVVASGNVAVPEPLGSILCLSLACPPAQLEDEIVSAGFVVERTWDESAGLSELIDRIEVRGRLLETIARDAGGPQGVAPALCDLVARLGDDGGAASLLNETRRAVDDGRIGYTAVVARAV